MGEKFDLGNGAMMDIEEFEATPECAQKMLLKKMDELGLYELCKHTILNVVRVSNNWRYSELKKMLKKACLLYQPSTDQIYLQYFDSEIGTMGLFPVLNYLMFKRFYRDFQNLGIKIF